MMYVSQAISASSQSPWILAKRSKELSPGSGGVGSNVVQPLPGIQTSTQEWASDCLRMVQSVSSECSPPLNPFTTRVCRPWVRAMIAMAVAKYSQWPGAPSRRNRFSGETTAWSSTSRE